MRGALLAAAAAALSPTDVQPWDVTCDAGLASRYVSEGVQQIGGSPIAFAIVDASHEGWQFGAVLVQGLDQTYSEYELGASRSAEFGAWNLTVGAAYIDQRPETGHDWELSGYAGRDFDKATVELAYVESVRGTGGLASVGVSTSFWRGVSASADGRITKFYDLGYVNHAGHGANHLEFEIGFNRETWRLAALLTVPQALLRDAEEPSRVWGMLTRRF